jgi:hypothetical protein
LPTLLFALRPYLRPLLLELLVELERLDFFFAPLLLRLLLAELRRVPLCELLERRLELDFLVAAISI